MRFTGDLRAWLLWVIKIRFVIITLLFAIDYAIRQLVPNPANQVSIERLGTVAIFWYVLGLFYLVYYELSRDYLLQAYLQIYTDILVITAVVHVTGDLESNYLSLYLVAIILASILLPRARAYGVAAVSFVCLGALLELAYLPTLYPEVVGRHPDLALLASSSTVSADVRALAVKILASLFGFLAVAYLTSFLAERLRETGAELRHKTGQVASLHAINENIIQSMRGGLIRTDLEGNIRELNPAGAAILGRDPLELKGQPIRFALPGLDAEGGAPAGRGDGSGAGGRVHSGASSGAGSGYSSGARAAGFHAIQQGNSGEREGLPKGSLPARREILYGRPNGGRRILGISASPLYMPDAGVVGYIYTFQDVTEEKRREANYRAKDRMAALGRLAAGIAHEIRNPLASIAGSVKLLQGISELEGDQAKLIDIVRRESSRLDKLVSDFLVYSREQKFEFRLVDLKNLLEETLLLLGNHPSFSRSCRLERRLPEHSVIACVDPDKIRQVFWNICDNSLKAMPQGGTLTAEIVDNGGSGVRVVLSDTGIGLTSAQLEKLFEPFHPRFADGTGLGLAITHQIVEGHQGRIQVESEVGKGSRFVIDLPKTREETAG